MLNMDESYPVAYDTLADEDNFFEYVNCYHPFRPDVTVSSADAQLILGTAGFYKGVEYMQDACAQNTGDANGENRGDCIVDELLNNVSGSFRAGLICCLKDNLSNEEGYEKIFSFLSTRNNNFSNRAQKWQVKLTSQPDATDKWNLENILLRCFCFFVFCEFNAPFFNRFARIISFWSICNFVF